MLLKTLWNAAFNGNRPLLNRRLPDCKLAPPTVTYHLADGNQQHYPQLLAPSPGTPITRPSRAAGYKRGLGERWLSLAIEMRRLPNFYDGLSLRIAGHLYEPDLAYIDMERGIFIDIENDEPHTMGRRVPTHVAGSDDRRNRLFTQAGWIVLRFSERQSIASPLSVLRTVIDVARAIDPGIGMPKALADVPPVEADQCWNREMAWQYARSSYRNTYLRKHIPLYRFFDIFY